MMRKAIKSKQPFVHAYELGQCSESELAMIAAGKIRVRADGMYELFSLEAINGKGELASAGDFFKIDGLGAPYPIRRELFLKEHCKIADDLYEQRAKELEIWTVEDGMCEAILYLIEQKGLVIDETSYDRYFTAPLHGTMESAPQDAVVVFYTLTRDCDGAILDAQFNFVARSEFDRTYECVYSIGKG